MVGCGRRQVASGIICLSEMKMVGRERMKEESERGGCVEMRVRRSSLSMDSSVSFFWFSCGYMGVKERKVSVSGGVMGLRKIAIL